MGRWLQVVDGMGPERPVVPSNNPNMTYKELEDRTVFEYDAYALMYAVKYVPEQVRPDFGMLVHICHSLNDNYVDEYLWLSPDESEQVLVEYRRFAQVCFGEVLIKDVDGAEVLKDWENSHLGAREDYQIVTHQIGLAVSNRQWILLSL